ncbi:hypothetical protein E2C01_016279 [Portunus trituberculatus]|uniref:Uncharacterized protein n=1 Tax=Portunus trituberculatus TaxID=210409 RepID=A0A5B7DQ64_PORTR|nr:hypothetical protein [Portunus trituberculatus]
MKRKEKKLILNLHSSPAEEAGAWVRSSLRKGGWVVGGLVGAAASVYASQVVWINIQVSASWRMGRTHSVQTLEGKK